MASADLQRKRRQVYIIWVAIVLMILVFLMAIPPA